MEKQVCINLLLKNDGQLIQKRKRKKNAITQFIKKKIMSKKKKSCQVKQKTKQLSHPQPRKKKKYIYIYI